MQQTQAPAPRYDSVRFFAPGWDERTTASHEDELRRIERYVRVSSRQQGLSTDEIIHDLNERFPHLGTISVIRSETPNGATFWVEFSDSEEGGLH